MNLQDEIPPDSEQIKKYSHCILFFLLYNLLYVNTQGLRLPIPLKPQSLNIM